MTDKMPTAFTVDARNWIRGGKFGGGVLLSDTGKMCCLGFLGEACGVKRDDLRNHGAPSCVENKDNYPNFTAFPDDEFITANDDRMISDKERVATLRRLFKERGITVRFKNLPKGRAFTELPKSRSKG